MAPGSPVPLLQGGGRGRGGPFPRGVAPGYSVSPLQGENVRESDPERLTSLTTKDEGVVPGSPVPPFQGEDFHHPKPIHDGGGAPGIESSGTAESDWSCVQDS